MPTANVNLDTTQYVRINMGFNPMLLQAHRDAVRIVFNDVKPSKGNPSFHELSGSDNVPYPVPLVDTQVWALATTGMASLTVTEFTGGLDGENPVDTLAELAVVLTQQLCVIISNQRASMGELRLINARLEEGFGTEIDEDDIDG